MISLLKAITCTDFLFSGFCVSPHMWESLSLEPQYPEKDPFAERVNESMMKGLLRDKGHLFILDKLIFRHLGGSVS